jgi:dTDP-4-amino-4,6-dideoxygalactose transaminase
VYIAQLWENGWITNRGKLVKELEQKLVDFLGIPEMLLIGNGTLALQLALKALEVKDEVITTPFSYVATTNALIWENCTPVFTDIDPETLCINPALIEAAITEKTTAILATHVYGIPCDIEAIDQIAQKHGLKVIYDAAHCFGVTYKGQSIFNYGDLSTISCHATKLFHTIEGGGIVCNSKEMFDHLHLMHTFGHIGDEYFINGINGKMSEFHAAMGLCILPKMPKLIQKRKDIAALYNQLLAGTSLSFPRVPEADTYNFAYYPIIFDNEETLLKVVQGLNNDQIYPRRYFYPSLNTLPHIITKQPCPVSEDIACRVICLPMAHDLTAEDQERICRIIKQYLI